ncbi:MAG: WD40 repeat domain-containing protein, partial [Dolichospermum sp.]
DQYYNTLMDFDFISLKIQHPDFGVESLIMDYALIDDLKNSCKLKPEEITNLELVRGALLLSSHILKQLTNQLAAQLWGTLQCFPQQPIQNLLKSASESHNVWLRPITASLRWITAVAITPDGKKAISASRDKTLKLWNLQTGQEINTFKGHEDWVTILAISPDGKKAISASRDKTLKLWNLDQGLEINTLILDSPISSCTFSADGFTVIAKEESGRVHFFL